MHGIVAYGVVEASALLAIELLRIADENHSNAGFSFHLVPEEDWSLYVCFLENTMVLPAGQGRGFQRMPLAPTLSRTIGKAVGVRWRSPLELRESGKLNGKRNVNGA